MHLQGLTKENTNVEVIIILYLFICKAKKSLGNMNIEWFWCTFVVDASDQPTDLQKVQESGTRFTFTSAFSTKVMYIGRHIWTLLCTKSLFLAMFHICCKFEQEIIISIWFSFFEIKYMITSRKLHKPRSSFDFLLISLLRLLIFKNF